MILTKQAITILQNFQTINPSIVIRKGSVLRTMSSTESVFATAKVEDVFPKTIAIYDLSKFLGILSLTKDDSEIKFNDSAMEIIQGKSVVRYAYCPEQLIDSPPEGEDIELPSIDVSFQLDNETWQQVTRAMHILGFQEFAFVGEDGELSIQALSTRNESSDTFSTVIGETDLTFKCVIDADKMRLVPDNYNVNITKHGLAHFKGEHAEYWIAISVKSEFE